MPQSLTVNTADWRQVGPRPFNSGDLTQVEQDAEATGPAGENPRLRSTTRIARHRRIPIRRDEVKTPSFPSTACDLQLRYRWNSPKSTREYKLTQCAATPVIEYSGLAADLWIDCEEENVSTACAINSDYIGGTVTSPLAKRSRVLNLITSTDSRLHSHNRT